MANFFTIHKVNMFELKYHMTLNDSQNNFHTNKFHLKEYIQTPQIKALFCVLLGVFLAMDRTYCQCKIS